MSTRSPELERTLQEWLEAKLRGDRDLILALLSDDPGVSAIGTGVDEWWAGPEAFAAAHGDAPPFTAAIERLEVREQGDTAWGTALARVPWGEEELVVRLTTVLVREPGGWRIVHTHASAEAA